MKAKLYSGDWWVTVCATLNVSKKEQWFKGKGSPHVFSHMQTF